MRRIAQIKKHPEYKRLMIDVNKDGVFLYLYDHLEDGPCTADLWFESIEETENYCLENFQVAISSFTAIEEPSSGCQRDWIRPTKLEISPDGKRQFLKMI
jgi:hypothetical protein